MVKRTKLTERELPGYSRGEEMWNMSLHIAGSVLGLVALVWCLILSQTPVAVVTSIVYGGTMILLYTTSSIYHGLRNPMTKKVFQVIDHCMIYVYIAGTYTIIALVSLRPEYPVLAWVAVAFQWGIAALAVTLTAIDLKRYQVFSMACYIIMGWSALVAIGPVLKVLGPVGAALLLLGGVSYTIGAILYMVGRGRRYIHAVFHVFILLGSLLQLFCIVFYVF
ncbi:MAG: hemolysin III family protein [Actinobacteria bacterium]|nr:hemolysin III family protein [Actinomycetota bacterium]MBU1944638.1 hemolysin III family protein [Actinomycetota bacterium]MBU2689190.1 hemolysin III family protein [Actinomycetota bacterium]